MYVFCLLSVQSTVPGITVSPEKEEDRVRGREGGSKKRREGVREEGMDGGKEGKREGGKGGGREGGRDNQMEVLRGELDRTDPQIPSHASCHSN